MKLLFAVDLNENFEPVLDEAVEWAQRLDATLDLVYVGFTADLYEFVTDAHVRSILATEAGTLRKQEATRLEQLLARIPEAHRGKYHQLSGPAAPAIVELEHDFDAVLVATHGRTGLAHLWLGSIAEQLVRTSIKPVIVLRLPAA